MLVIPLIPPLQKGDFQTAFKMLVISESPLLTPPILPLVRGGYERGYRRLRNFFLENLTTEVVTDWEQIKAERKSAEE